MSKTKHEPVVYYLCRFGFFDTVKIGTTVDLPKRMAKFRAAHSGIPDEWHLLAVEPGHFELEAKRHRQFAGSRIIGEWFWVTPDLKAHLETLTTDLLEEVYA